MECEICGRNEAVCLVFLENAKMNSCAGCAKGGKVVYYFDDPASNTPLAPRSFRARSEDELIEGYGKAIKSAREKAGLSIEELGLKIAEKANYLDHVEREKTLPSIALAHKLEKFFKLRLIQTTSATEPQSEVTYGKKELTLLDVAEIERKGDKKKK